MDGWTEITRIPVIRPPRDPNIKPPTASCTVFDGQSDLLWVGDTSGFIGSYTDNVLAPYTRFAAHKSPILQLLSHEKGVISTDGKSLRLTNRRGLPIFTLANEEIGTIQRITFLSPNELLVVTTQHLVKFDISKAAMIGKVPYKQDVKLIASNKRHIAIGRKDGKVDIFDPRSNTIIKTFDCSTGTLSDIDLKEHTLVTCGLTRRYGNYVQDPIVSVFDLRSLKPVTSVSFPAGAAFVRLHPKLSSVCVIASKSGQIQVVDLSNPTNSVSLYQVDVGPMIVSFEISTTGDYLGILDGFSLLHLWSHNPEHASMSSKKPLEYPTIPDTHLKIPIDDGNVPLNSIGLPYYKETLLSAWPSQLIFTSAGTLTKPVDSSILQNAELIEGYLVAPYDKDVYGARNEKQRYIPISTDSETDKFLSKKNKNTKAANIFEYKTEVPSKIPNAFKRLEILYSKFGVEDFDFDSFNKTKYSGLETHVDNSYTNSILQLYRFVPEIFSFVLSNLAKENFEPDSLLRELGYLFDMLVKSNGKNFRPSNFQYTLSNSPDFANLGLVDKVGDHKEITKRIQLFNRFLLERLTFENNEFIKLVGIQIEKRTRSSSSGNFTKNVLCNHTLEISSPANPNNQSVSKSLNVLSFIESSLNDFERKMFMNDSGQVEVIEISQSVVSLPLILSINLHLTTEDKKNIRNTKDWLVPKFYAGLSNLGIVLTENSRTANDFFKEYELVGYIAEISGETEKDKHLVTFIKTENKWFLFNDFLVIEVPESEALNVSYWWKTPVTLIYRNQNDSKFNYDAWKSGLDDSILYKDYFANGTKEGLKKEYELLTRQEAPKPGSLVALDAEFVTLEEEQYEIKSNGVRSLIRPSIQTLARVSVLRENGVPFIDDYVVVQEDGIHDYLTSFSGIEPGDLDPRTTNKTLVTREVAYRKLWLLINLGCIFVGHGLSKDFRTINVSVPKDQVRDTAVFFYKGQRILSLRFLAYVILGKRVQTGNHDSIEDAHTALLIYKKYLELKENGTFESVLDSVYKRGQELKFRPPEEDV